MARVWTLPEDGQPATWIEPEAGSLPPGGTTGQVLTKESDADGDAGWEPGGGSIPDPLTIPFNVAPTDPAPASNHFLSLTAPAGTQNAGPYLIEVIDEEAGDQLTLDSYGTLALVAPTGAGNLGRLVITQREADGTVVALKTSGGPAIQAAAAADTDVLLSLQAALGADVMTVGPGSVIGFFNKASAPVAQPTGVAVDAAAIHAALVSLGLITA